MWATAGQIQRFKQRPRAVAQLAQDRRVGHQDYRPFNRAEIPARNAYAPTQPTRILYVPPRRRPARRAVATAQAARHWSEQRKTTSRKRSGAPVWHAVKAMPLRSKLHDLTWTINSANREIRRHVPRAACAPQTCREPPGWRKLAAFGETKKKTRDKKTNN